MRAAFTDPRYRRATWVNIGHIVVHELVGFNIMLIYSNTIFH
jgi:hypothetical protein